MCSVKKTEPRDPGLLRFQSAGFLSTQGIRTHVLQVDIGALIKWLASRMPVLVLAGFSTKFPSVPVPFGTPLGYREVSYAVASGKRDCQCQAVRIAQPQPDRQCAT